MLLTLDMDYAYIELADCKLVACFYELFMQEKGLARAFREGTSVELGRPDFQRCHPIVCLEHLASVCREADPQELRGFAEHLPLDAQPGHCLSSPGKLVGRPVERLHKTSY